MFAPETLLKQKKLVPAQMTDGEIVEAIGQLATGVHTHASSDYYLQIIGAIQILAQALTVGKSGEVQKTTYPKSH